MKKKPLLYSIVGLLLVCVGGFSYGEAQESQETSTPTAQYLYCQNSSICGTAPQQFVLMLDFVREMMNSIKTIGTEGDYLGEYVHPNRFKGTEFVPEEKTVVDNIAKNVVQKLKFAAATAAIFGDPTHVGGVEETIGSIVLTTENKVFMRDSKLIEEMESLLNTKKYEIGLGGGWYSQINQENIRVMQGIIDSYVQKGLLSKGWLSEGVTYTTITSLLTQILSSMRTFLYYNETERLDNFTVVGGDEKTAKIFFSSAAITSIKNTYDCARGWEDICDKNKTTFTDTREALITSFKTSSSDNKKIFTDAVKRLGALFSKSEQENDDDYNDREYDLLNATYGQSGEKKGILFDLIDFNFSTTNTSENEQTSAVSDTILSTNLVTEDLPSTLGEISNNKKDNVPVVLGTTSLLGQDRLTNVLISYVSDVFDRQTTDYTLISFAEIKNITPAFNVLGQQINVIKTDIIGDKNKEGSLIKNLGQACETQCGGGGSCR